MACPANATFYRCCERQPLAFLQLEELSPSRHPASDVLCHLTDTVDTALVDAIGYRDPA